MRSNLGNKFRDYLQELPNEPLTFTEALKKVQEIEEKLEQDDAQLSRELGARKRMGWIKLKGREKEPDKDKDKHDSDKQDEGNKEAEKEATEPAADPPPKANGTQVAADKVTALETNNQLETPLNGQSKLPAADAAASAPETTKRDNRQQQPTGKAASDNLDEGDKAPIKSTATKRRRQKPNLSRTKLAKERPLLVESSDNLERPAERSSHLELPEPTSHRPTKTHKKKPKSEKNEVTNGKGETHP